jgi:NAD(P)-dependent dehydrogenase (short-subunit alcohol dehydrogenase family)
MAGHMAGALTSDDERDLSLTPAEELAAVPLANPSTLSDSQDAYRLSKKANQLRVQAASGAWGKRGARINSISPGIISTPMGQEELSGRNGDSMRAMISASGTGRIGTPADIAQAAAFLLGPDSTFITGTDLLVDGGAVAALRTQRLQSKARKD